MSPLRVLADAEAVHRAAAQDFRERALEAVAARGRFTVALAGGSTPRGAYRALAGLDGLPWDRVEVFWGDERCVAPDSPDSNARMATEALLDRVPVDPARVHRIRGELGGPAARDVYARELAECFGGEPVFDLVHLGLGPDGHVASLFPGSAALESREQVVLAFPSPGLSPPVERVSLGLGVIDAARAVVFLVTGEAKAGVVARVLEGADDLPARRVRGDVLWLLDRPAAAEITL